MVTSIRLARLCYDYNDGKEGDISGIGLDRVVLPDDLNQFMLLWGWGGVIFL